MRYVATVLVLVLLAGCAGNSVPQQTAQRAQPQVCNESQPGTISPGAVTVEGQPCGGGGGTTYYYYATAEDGSRTFVGTLNATQRQTLAYNSAGSFTGQVTGTATSTGNTPSFSFTLNATNFSGSGTQKFPSNVAVDANGNFTIATSHGTASGHMNIDNATGYVVANGHKITIAVNSTGSVTLGNGTSTITEPASGFAKLSSESAFGPVAYSPMIMSDGRPLVVADARSKFLAIALACGIVAMTVFTIASAPVTLSVGLVILGGIGLYSMGIVAADQADHLWDL